MKILNAFDESTTSHFLDRLEKLSPDSQAEWGKMSAAQMIAHLNVPYDIDNGKIDAKYSGFAKLMMKLFVKKIVVGDKAYKKNSRTAPNFLIANERNFNAEKAELIDNIKKTQQKGAAHYDGKESPAFGALAAKEWSNMFSKHLDHHFTQFKV